MSNFSFVSDNDLNRRGFISKESILEIVSQEDIFKLVFPSIPDEYDYITSPFRKDNNPGCWFHYNVDSKLRFVDFGNSAKINGISMNNIDCFDAVQIYYRLRDFYATLKFIYDKLIVGKNIELEKRILIENRKQKKPVKLLTEARPFEQRDLNFWFRFGILKAHLIEDRTFPLSRFHALNTKKGDFSSTCYDLAYGFNNFPEGRKKLYFPLREKSNRFLTTCRKNDIGGIDTLAPCGRQLIISKSYKDWRVLKNMGKHTVWFQNEGMIPDIDKLTMLVKRFKEVIVFFDNDSTGIQASIEVSNLINSLFVGKAKALWLPELLLKENITDPSDFYSCKGKNNLGNFLLHFT